MPLLVRQLLHTQHRGRIVVRLRRQSYRQHEMSAQELRRNGLGSSSSSGSKSLRTEQRIVAVPIRDSVVLGDCRSYRIDGHEAAPLEFFSPELVNLLVNMMFAPLARRHGREKDIAARMPNDALGQGFGGALLDVLPHFKGLNKI